MSPNTGWETSDADEGREQTGCRSWPWHSEGNGFSVIDGQRFVRQRGDFFVVPPWAWHEHATDSREQAILFSVQDTPEMRVLGLYREQPFVQNQGHQKGTETFGD